MPSKKSRKFTRKGILFNYRLFILLLLIIFLLIRVQGLETTKIAGGDYDRYLDTLWAYEIKKDNYVPKHPFPNSPPSLYSNANGYRFNLIPALIRLFLHLVSDIKIEDTRSLPVLEIFFFLIIYLLARTLYQKRMESVILCLFLYFFFMYIVCTYINGINRIGLFYSYLFLFIYVFLKTTNRSITKLSSVGLIFLLYLIPLYSTSAITISIFLLILYLFHFLEHRRFSQFFVVTIYISACILYYFLIYEFMGHTIIAINNRLENTGLNINLFKFIHLGAWEGKFVYTPHYTIAERFFLVYPYLILGFLLLFALRTSIVTVKRTKKLNSYIILLFSFLLYGLMAFIVNAIIVFPTSGLDVIDIFSFFSPLFAAGMLDGIFLKDRYKEQERTMKVSGLNRYRDVSRISSSKILQLIFLFLILSLGIYSNFNYMTLETRKEEKVTSDEINACLWLYKYQLNDSTVTSDFHMISTYVTLNKFNASHFLPMKDDEMIIELYYRVNHTYLHEKKVNYYIVSYDMRHYYIKHFIGTRTVPNPDLDNKLSVYNKVYDNNQLIFEITYSH